jgi:hypothetical protein
VLVLRIIGFALLVLVATALLGRYVMHGPVDRNRLAVSVAQATGSVDEAFGGPDPCRLTDRVGVYRCRVGDGEGSGTATYSVRLRPGSSCWDARRLIDASEGGMPRNPDGCVRAWQWSPQRLLDQGANFAEEHL